MRSLVASALVLIGVVTAVAPHRHGVNEQLVASAWSHTQGPDTEIAPATGDLSTGRTAGEHPCLACARQQQGQGLTATAGEVVAPRIQSILLAARPSCSEASGQGRHASLRGPPASTSSC